jgi:hypothetical protein
MTIMSGYNNVSVTKHKTTTLIIKCYLSRGRANPKL